MRNANDAQNEAEIALQEKEFKEQERQKAEADKILSEVSNLISAANKLDARYEDERKRKIEDAIKKLEQFPDNPILVDELNEIKKNHEY